MHPGRDDQWKTSFRWIEHFELDLEDH